MMTKAIFAPSVLLLLLFAPTLSASAEMQCSDCHPDKTEGAAVHAAVSMGCDSCHSGTHMGEQPAPKLIADPPDLCFNCHDQSAFARTVQHPPAAGGMCLTCHTPHAGPHPRLLTADVPSLCSTCHDPQASGRHVMAQFGPLDTHPLKDRPDPSRPGQALSCVSCHQPHSSERARLFQGSPAAGEKVCGHCHRKVVVVP